MRNQVFVKSSLSIPFFVLSSFLIVALAQPDWSALSCIFASALGYALFWRGMLKIHSKWGRFLLATLWFGAVQAVHLSWFMADRYVGAPIFIFLFILYGVLGVSFGGLSLLVSNLSIWRMLGVAGLGVLLEWGRLFFLSGFSWNPIGLALTGTLWGMQMASVGGVFGLTFWILFTNLLALRLLKGPFSWRNLGVWVAVAITPYLFGMIEMAFHEKQMAKREERPLSVIAVQAAFFPEMKVSYAGEADNALSPLDLWKKIFHLIRPHYGKEVDLIALSESVVPFGEDIPLFTVGELARAFEDIFGTELETGLERGARGGNGLVARLLADVFGADVVIGLEAVDRSEKPRRAYNAGFLYPPFLDQKYRYEKRVLVPLGEYIPFDWCRKFLSKYGIHDSFSPGKEAKVFPGKRVPLAMSICYEETYGHMMRENRLKGAGLLVNLTNDVWYPHSRLPLVHFLHGRIRAVEMGIPLVRSCNTGVTCGIDSLGRLKGCLECERAGFDPPAEALYCRLSPYSYPTLYTRLGDYLVISFASATVVLALLVALISQRGLAINILGIVPLRKNDD